jgi:uncharacterized Zn finger protein
MNKPDQTCPMCGEIGQWKLSGRGKHFVLRCKEHGFIRMIRHPLNPEPKLKRNWFQSLICFIFGIK